MASLTRPMAQATTSVEVAGRGQGLAPEPGIRGVPVNLPPPRPAPAGPSPGLGKRGHRGPAYPGGQERPLRHPGGRALLVGGG